MKNLALRLVLLSFVFAGSPLVAEQEDAATIRSRAKILLEGKQWSRSAEEFRKANELDPSNPDGWLMQGQALEQLNRPSEAAEAYRKYLALTQPSSERDKIVELAASLDLKGRQTRRDDDPWMPEAAGQITDQVDVSDRQKLVQKNIFSKWGIGAGFSPYYSPTVARQLDSKMHFKFDLGVTLPGAWIVSVQYAQGDGGNFSVNNSAYGVSHSLAILSVQKDIPLVFRTGDLGPYLLYVPVSGGVFTNSISGGFNTTTLSLLQSSTNQGIDLATGLGFRWYLLHPFAVDFSLRYHFGFPFKSFLFYSGSTEYEAKASNGDTVTGSTSGLDFRVGTTIYF